MKSIMLAYGWLFASALVIGCNDSGSGDGNGDTTSLTTGTTTMDTAAASAPASSAEMSATPLQGQDSSFALEAASAGMMEVELGHLAGQNASNPRVKSFGEMMVRDHSTANDELKRLAMAKNLTLGDSMMKKHRDHVASMRNMTGRNFDRHYMDMMEQDHKEDIQKFERASNSATDADLKAWAGKTLPVLRTHLDSAQAIKKAKL